MRSNSKLIAFCSTAAVAATFGTSCQQAKADQQPNIIIIYADDVGYGDFSCNGAHRVQTPNVDRLSNSGVRFTNAHTPSSTSTPARYGLLTGQYPWRKEGTGIATGDAAMIISPDQYTIADMLKSVGYTTGAVGKWHLGLGDTAGAQDWNGIITPGLSDIGFDYSFIMAATGDRVPCVYIENQKVVNLDPSDPIQVSYTQPFPGEPTGKDNPELLTMTPSQGHNQAIINGVPRIGYMKGGKAALWNDTEISDRITEKALEFITDNKSKPFFLYFGTNDIHVPRLPNERFVGKSGMGARGDAILSFDYTVGKVMDLIDSLGIADNTIVILSSDNGPVVDDGYNDLAAELLGDHTPWGPFRGGKYSAFEAGTRVPMIVRWGKNTPPAVSDALLSHIDIYASLAKLTGAKIPKGAAEDSHDALEALFGASKDREYVVEQNLNGTLSIIMDGYKYIEPSNNPKIEEYTKTELGNDTMPQLYNLTDDIGEKINIADQYPDKVKLLDAKLKQVSVGRK